MYAYLFRMPKWSVITDKNGVYKQWQEVQDNQKFWR